MHPASSIQHPVSISWSSLSENKGCVFSLLDPKLMGKIPEFPTYSYPSRIPYIFLSSLLSQIISAFKLILLAVETQFKKHRTKILDKSVTWNFSLRNSLVGVKAMVELRILNI
jgi:hypothetical protein